MKKIGFTILIAISILVLIVISIYEIKNIYYTIKYEKKLEEISADDLEIEKKWLIKEEDIPYDLSKAEKIKIEQTYICFSPEMRVRRINDGEYYTFAIKTNMTSDGMIRDEKEFEITEAEYNNLITKKEGNTINKTRYQFLDRDNILAIDIFAEDLKGLAYLEIEFTNKDEADNYSNPSWVISDITSDLNYKNGHLARYGIPKSYFEYID